MHFVALLYFSGEIEGEDITDDVGQHYGSSLDVPSKTHVCTDGFGKGLHHACVILD